MRMLLAAALAAAIASPSVASQAAPALATETVSVRYGDLDLTTPSGVKSLRKRIVAALDTVCGSLADPVFETYLEAVRCRKVAKPATDAEFARLTAPHSVDLAAVSPR